MKKTDIGQTLKNLLKEKGLSVRKAAASIPVPQATLNSMVNGRPPGRLDHLIAIAKFFNLSLDELVFGEARATIEFDELEFNDLFDGLVRLRIQKVIGPKKRRKS